VDRWAEKQGQLIFPYFDDALAGNETGDYGKKRRAEENSFSSADTSESQMSLDDKEADLLRRTADSDSPFKHYLFVAVAFGMVGLVLIGAGVVQWWLQRSVRQKWLFSAVQDDPQSFPTIPTPAPLIAKKQQEESPVDGKNEKRGFRRAA
jgi:hypothetical protein